MVNFSRSSASQGSPAAAHNFNEKLRAAGLNIAAQYVESGRVPAGKFWHGNVVLLANRDTVQRLIEAMRPLKG